LLQGLPNVAQVAVGKPVPAYDMHCPLMSLPAVLGVAPAHFADTVPYLRAAPDDVAAWQARLAHLPGRRVGVVWAGNPAYPADRKRSVKFATLAPLLDAPGVSFVSLQLGEAAAEAAGRFAFDAAPFIGDYADTAAAIEALDVLISVDTSAAHLAGALGRPVWLLNRADTDWRWLLERSDSPWYPSMRIFRQTAPGDWGAVIEQVRASF
jgi:ADP-heptose:LPS heptosyltransferase